MIERLYDEYTICLFRYISKRVYVRIRIWGIEYMFVRVTFWKRPSVRGGRPLCLACSSSRVGALPAAFTRGRHGGRARPSTLKTYPSPRPQKCWQNILKDLYSHTISQMVMQDNISLYTWLYNITTDGLLYNAHLFLLYHVLCIGCIIYLHAFII
jgi:hypothetical protein